MSRHAVRSRGWAAVPAAELVARLVPEHPHLVPLPAPGPGTTFAFFLKPILGGTK